MNAADYEQIVTNLNNANEYERTLNKQLMGKLDAYRDILITLVKLLITEVKERG